MTQTSLIERLAPEEHHVLFGESYPQLDYLAASGMTVVRFSTPIDWREKPRVLDIPPERVWKTLYLQAKEGLYGVCLPMNERVDWGKLAEALEMPRRMRKEFRRTEVLPQLQKPQSCTPFIARDERLVRKIVIQQQETRDGSVLHDDAPLDWGFPGREDLSILLSHANNRNTNKYLQVSHHNS